ncbi:ABC transporter permease subunit [Nocardioides sp. MAH-18]|uniref:ABC transporter permease subunit n=1 Tax=Nocardioides agri TaxID=2682843 RepID=A0A6L6XN74_9ACTN|nr:MULTISPECIES: ABC transporter permease subunit [unclassified Nocardioides]MBA2953177.1 ABC transporter permease subunit [Nocardioides sp. CGMCC 1.13656]MVQ48046.1 ABC transporter permease subunit [Nocardioides sp. MAH-18]
MMRLVGVELTRLRWRRAVLALVLLAIVVPALIAASRIWATRPLSQDELDDVASMKAEEVARCVEHPRQYGIPKAHAEEQCEDLVRGWYYGARQPLSLSRERREGSGIGVVAVLTAFLLLAGTTFVGHDWNTGSMSNQLLFEARRGRVWTAKAVAVTGVALAVSAVVSTAFWLTMWSTMRARDIPMLDGALGDSLAFGLRGALFAAAAALGGYALTMLFRSTVATVGVLFGVALAGGIIISVLGIGDQWQPQKNVSAIVKNGTLYYVQPPPSCEGRVIEPGDDECLGERELPLWRGATYYGLALVATAGASVVSFRRRDVP